MRSIVKISWKKSEDGWKADLLMAEPGGFEKISLIPDREFSLELVDERRCTGFTPEPGERRPCPEFREIKKGSKCPECRGKDIYSDYVRGDQSTDLEGEFSVYLALISDNIKVGVTRTSNIPRRWVEQGTDYGVEIASNLSSSQALKRESNISSNGTTERIRKESKIPKAKNSDKLDQFMDQEGFQGKIDDVQDLTVYPETGINDVQRKGLFEGELKSVKGQIISNGRVGLALTSGKILKNPDQRSLGSF